MLVALGELLRSSLKAQARWVQLHEELHLVQGYLDIEKARFEDKLDVQAEIANRLERIWVPSGILLPLFDNAIKHGAYNENNQRHIHYRFFIERDSRRFTLRNRGQLSWTPSTPSLGLGVQSVRARVETELGDVGSFASSS